MAAKPSFTEGLLKFLQSPEAQGLSVGLLGASQPRIGPNVGFGEALGLGLAKSSEYKNEDRKLKNTERTLEEQIRHNKQIEQLTRMQRDAAMAKVKADQDRLAAFGNIFNQGGAQSPQYDEQQFNQPPAMPQLPPVDFQQGMSPQTEAFPYLQEMLDQQSGLGMSDQNQFPMTPVGAPAMPAQAPLPPPMPASPSGIPSGDDTVPVQLPNGQRLDVPRTNFARAQFLYAAGDLEGAAKALTEPSTKDNEIIQTAKYLYPDDINKQREFIKDFKMKSGVNVNIGDKVETVKQQKIAEMDVKQIDEANARAKPGRELYSRAKETLDIAKQMRAKGIDPGRFWLTKQLDREKIKSALGVKASQENVSLVERLNKNAVYMMSEQVKNLGGRPNQFIEQQFAKAVPGSDVTLDTIENLSKSLITQGRENQFEGRFMREYNDKNDSLAGAQEAFEAWLDTEPFLQMDEKGKPRILSEREIEASWRLWVNPKATYERLLKKPLSQSTQAEIDFMARYEE